MTCTSGCLQFRVQPEEPAPPPPLFFAPKRVVWDGGGRWPSAIDSQPTAFGAWRCRYPCPMTMQPLASAHDRHECRGGWRLADERFWGAVYRTGMVLFLHRNTSWESPRCLCIGCYSSLNTLRTGTGTRSCACVPFQERPRQHRPPPVPSTGVCGAHAAGCHR